MGNYNQAIFMSERDLFPIIRGKQKKIGVEAKSGNTNTNSYLGLLKQIKQNGHKIAACYATVTQNNKTLVCILVIKITESNQIIIRE